MINLGTITNDAKDLGQRDAQHVSVVLVQSESKLHPGAFVRFTDNTFKKVTPTVLGDQHGVVDPFVASVIKPGMCFLVYVYPNLTENMTHNYDLKITDIPIVSLGIEESVNTDFGYDGCRGCYD